jgi:hypothetical protein
LRSNASSRGWREVLTSLDLKVIADGFRALGIDGKTCKSLPEAKALAQELVTTRDKPFERMKLAVAFLNAPREVHRRILERWSAVGYPPISDYAPYAAHVLTVEVFFQIALAANLISSQRPSNRVDVAYLFYLPLCMVFISWDGLHQRCAPLFLREDQDFIWSPDPKSELQRLDRHFAVLPETTKEKGIMIRPLPTGRRRVPNGSPVGSPSPAMAAGSTEREGHGACEEREVGC